MSTKIYEGLRVATPEGQGMLRFRKEVFDTAEPLLRKGYDRMVAMKCVDILDRFMVRGEIPEGLDSEKSDSSVAEVVTKFLLDNAKEMSRELRARDPEHDFTFSLSVYPFDDYTLLFPICEQQDVIATYRKSEKVSDRFSRVSYDRCSTSLHTTPLCRQISQQTRKMRLFRLSSPYDAPADTA